MDDKDGRNAQEARQEDTQAPNTSSPPKPVPLTEEQAKRVLDLSEKECPAFYKMVVWIATTFLAGTLAFIEKIVPNPIPWTFILLGLGWVGLVLTIVFIMKVRRINIEMFHKYIENDESEVKKFQAKGRNRMAWADWSLTAGVLLVMAFGFVNFAWKKPAKELTDDHTSAASRSDDVPTRSANEHDPAERRTVPATASTDVPTAPSSGESASAANTSAPKEVKDQP